LIENDRLKILVNQANNTAGVSIQEVSNVTMVTIVQLTWDFFWQIGMVVDPVA